MSPFQALQWVREVEQSGVKLKIIGVAGPGEPLYNEETFDTFALIKAQMPNVHLCVSTNGLLLEENAARLATLSVETITVTINCLRPETAEMIYRHVGGKSTPDAYAAFLDAQWRGLKAAVAAGLTVKINSVFVPGVNDEEIPRIAQAGAKMGAFIHNILPVIPREELIDLLPPTHAAVADLRMKCAAYLPQFSACRHCRADAVIDADDTCGRCESTLGEA